MRFDDAGLMTARVGLGVGGCAVSVDSLAGGLESAGTVSSKGTEARSYERAKRGSDGILRNNRNLKPQIVRLGLV